MAPASIIELVRAQPAERPALSGIGRKPMSYGDLAEFAAQTVNHLNTMGIGREDRIAVILPNGPELAAAFVGIAAGASVAPLNPAFREDEFSAYFADLAVKTVVVEKRTSSAARTVARRRGIPVLEVETDPQRPAGWFRLFDERQRHDTAARGRTAESSDEALVLHTSGTTSRPKIVPLTQRNLLHSARNVQAVLQLRTDDIGLNIMPLFHIHGLVASLLASLSAGATVVCAPAFDPLKFYRWFSEAKPTWFTGVPTMHQAILARAPHNQSVVAATCLRFIRSCSSALPSKIADDLEQLFQCPVVEAYGMTEAAHQIACNPLPPRRRKIGTVGVPAGPEVCVLDEWHRPAGVHQVGEIVIRGSNVFSGYANNREANANSFVEGWFRTGDLGFVDQDGYLTVTARSKEIIVRGGEKIAPREIDEILHAHPAIEQALAFALPHPTLGEDVAAVVVLKDGAQASEYEIRSFVGARLAKFKVPRCILFRSEIPKNATGKPQRISLAKTLGLL
jgi:acyl-CoA synthetase (AMP-forming)/AMP-acid ligase II